MYANNFFIDSPVLIVLPTVFLYQSSLVPLKVLKIVHTFSLFILYSLPFHIVLPQITANTRKYTLIKYKLNHGPWEYL